MNVVYSTDDNYAIHAGISIKSLLENNYRDFEHINIYIIDNGITVENKNKLSCTVNNYPNSTLYFLDFEPYHEKLNLNMEWHISETAYARLFLESLVPNSIEKILYLDCDTIINGTLKDLWEIDLTNHCMAGVQDTVNTKTKEAVLVDKYQKYFNSGVLLINLKKWRDDKSEEKFLDFINKFNGRVTHHDQGVINGCYGDECQVLPLKYNFMTIHYFMNKEQIIKYFAEESDYYDSEQVNEAKSNPLIYHFTPSFTSRPWVKGCAHPRKDLYMKYKDLTPWKDVKLIKNNEKWYIRLINWRYRRLPF